MEDTRLVRPSFSHQKMEVGVKIDPVPEGLDGRDDAGRKRAPGQDLEVSGQGPEGAAAEVPQQTALELEEDPRHLIHSPHSSNLLAWQEGQNPWVLQGNVWRYSARQRGQRIRANPHCGLPQSR